MITPLTPNAQLDEDGVRRIVEHLIAGGVDGIFILGTTGESVSIPYAMRSRFAAIAVEQVAGRVRTYAGIANNIMSHSATAAAEYLAAGIDAVVAHPPFYYPLNNAELYDYFATLSGLIEGPLILYNMPATTHISIPLEVVERLCVLPNIIGLKDSERDIARQEAAIQIAHAQSDFAFFTGVAAYSTMALRLGADGTVPSSGNLIPDLCAEIYRCALSTDWERAQHFQERTDQIAAVYQTGRSLGQSLAGLKCAMQRLGLCGPTMMPPLQALAPDEQLAVNRALDVVGLMGAD